MKKLILLAAVFMPSFAFAQSSGIAWKNGAVLTAQQLQQLDNAKMNISSLGQPGFAPQLNALGQITNPVVGDVSQAKATSDGQTVSDVTQKAVNSVQQTSVGAANGVAPLDSNRALNSNLFTGPGGYTAALTRVLQNPSDIRQMGDPSTTGAWSALYASLPESGIAEAQTAAMPSGFAPATTKHILWRLGAHPLWPAPNGDLVEHYLDGKLEYDRYLTSGWAPPSLYLTYTNGSADVGSTNYGDETNPNWIANGVIPLRIESDNTDGAIGSSNGVVVNMALRGMHPYLNQDVGYSAGITRYGSDSVWGGAWQITDVSGLPGNDQFAQIGHEIDIIANGPVSGDNNRVFQWFKASPTPHGTWQSGHTYNTGDVIVAGDYVYIASTGGVSGNTLPSFPSSSGIVRDGTVVWTYGTTYAMQVAAYAEITAATGASYIRGIHTNALYHNALIDESDAQLDWGQSAVAIRLASGHPIAWTPDGAHNELYSSSNNAHVWQANGANVGMLDDNGNFSPSGSVVLPKRTTAQILATVSPVEGQTIYDTDNHAQVTYRCPTTSTCGWFPVQYGTALSN